MFANIACLKFACFDLVGSDVKPYIWFSLFIFCSVSLKKVSFLFLWVFLIEALFSLCGEEDVLN